jgi:integrase
MGVRKIKNSWWADFQFNHIRYRKRSPENSRSGAAAYEILLRQKLARGQSLERNSLEQEPTFEQFAWKWFEEYVISNNKYSEQRAKKYVLRSSLVPFFGRLSVGEITGHHVEQYKARQLETDVARKTINNRLTIFRKCICTAYEWLALPGAPPKVTWLKCQPTLADYLSPEECAVLLSSTRGLGYDMILTALRTGMRQGELRGLQWNSIDWHNRSIAVQHSRCDYTGELGSTKSNRIRHIPIDVDLCEVLFAKKKSTGYVFLNEKNKPFDAQSLKRRLARVRHRAGLRKIGWHTLRHTFASHLVMRGAPISAVQILMGHSSVTTTMRYAHLAPSTLRSVIDMLNPKMLAGVDFGQPGVNPWLRLQQRHAL